METQLERNKEYLNNSVFYPYRFFTFAEAGRILRVSKYWLRKYGKHIIDVKHPIKKEAFISMKDLELLMIKRFERCPGFNINEFRNDIGYGRQDTDK